MPILLLSLFNFSANADETRKFYINTQNIHDIRDFMLPNSIRKVRVSIGYSMCEEIEVVSEALFETIIIGGNPKMELAKLFIFVKSIPTIVPNQSCPLALRFKEYEVTIDKYLSGLDNLLLVL